MEQTDRPPAGATFTPPALDRPLRRRAGLDLFDILGDPAPVLAALRGRHDLGEWSKAAGTRHELTRFYWRPARPQGRPPRRMLRVDERGRLLLWAEDGDLAPLWRILLDLDLCEPWTRAALLDAHELAAAERKGAA